MEYIARHWVAELSSGQYKVADRVARLCANSGLCRASQTTIAGYLGLSREQVNRTLGQLRKVGLIDTRGRALIVIGWQDHDTEIRLCGNRQCRAEVAGRLYARKNQAESNAGARKGSPRGFGEGWSGERHLRAV